MTTQTAEQNAQLQTDSRIKVLISAYACRPDQGSEPGVGWNIVQQLVKYCEVWVLTRADNGPSLEAYRAKHPDPNLNVVYCDLPEWAMGWNANQRGVQLHYYIWQILAYFKARELYKTVKYDLIHHVTYVKYWSPSFLSLLPVPFIWGPVGGGESAPRPFWKDFSFRGQMYEAIRDGARWLGELDPFVSMTVRNSAVIRSTTNDTAQRLRHLGAKEVDLVPETGVSYEELDEFAKYRVVADGPLRFISMGRLLHWKGFHLGLRAFAQANLPDAEFWVVGDGPERQRLEKLANELGIAHQVTFWNRLSRNESLQKLGQSTALVHPSLHDSGGWVCLEAMAVGRPVICLDLGGPSTQIVPETGFKIPAHDPEQAIAGIAAKMITLAENPELRMAMQQAGPRRVREFYTWENRGQSLVKLYQETLQAQSPA